MANNEIPGWRKAAYYGGIVLMGIGFLVFLSTFFLVAGQMSDTGSMRMTSPFQPSPPNPMPRALTGMVLLIIGGGLRTVGARGLAGSGVVLDPQRARQDIEPWSRMAGGVVKDALSEIKGTDEGNKKRSATQPDIKVRCRNCQALNDEQARYCQQCGSQL